MTVLLAYTSAEFLTWQKSTCNKRGRSMMVSECPARRTQQARKARARCSFPAAPHFVVVHALYVGKPSTLDDFSPPQEQLGQE